MSHRRDEGKPAKETRINASHLRRKPGENYVPGSSAENISSKRGVINYINITDMSGMLGRKN